MFKALTVKPLLITIAILVATNLSLGIAWRMAAAERDGAVATADAASKLEQAALDRADELAATNGEWQGTVEVLNKRLGAAQQENSRLREDNRLALETARKRIDEAERTRRQAIAQRDARAAKDPGCRAFLEMPLCPALQAAASR